jgi:hypothetical protein
LADLQRSPKAAESEARQLGYGALIARFTLKPEY